MNASKAVGLNAYWMDANWFKGEFPAGAGNWRLPLSAVESDQYPHGVAAVSKLAHAWPHPLAMIMWVEPERVAADTYIAQNYPEYVFGCTQIELNGKPCPGGLLNLGNPDARAYITDFLCAMVVKFQLQVLRFEILTLRHTGSAMQTVAILADVELPRQSTWKGCIACGMRSDGETPTS